MSVKIILDTKQFGNVTQDKNLSEYGYVGRFKNKKGNIVEDHITRRHSSDGTTIVAVSQQQYNKWKKCDIKSFLYKRVVTIMEQKYFNCDCNSLEHLMRFSYFDDEADIIYVEMHLYPYRGIFKRIWAAVKYIFGHRSRYGDFDEILLSDNKIKELRDFCDEVLNKAKEIKK